MSTERRDDNDSARAWLLLSHRLMETQTTCFDEVRMAARKTWPLPFKSLECQLPGDIQPISGSVRGSGAACFW